MADIMHRVGIVAPVSQVQQAVSTAAGITGWLTDTKPDADGTMTAVFRAADGTEMGKVGFDITKSDARQVTWRFTSGPDEWVGTDVTFDFTDEGEYAIVLFGHRNWREPDEFLAHSSMKWATFLLSLKKLVETGKGEPSPHDVRVGNWS